MEYELSHMDMNMDVNEIDHQESSFEDFISQPPAGFTRNPVASHSYTESSVSTTSSHTLNDLVSQIEELQTKLKLSYRKLFALETESQKLTQEKNFYFYENKNAQELNSILTAKNEKIESSRKALEADLKLHIERNHAFKNLTETQKGDIARLSKFHVKIKTIIKPYIQQLKDRVISLANENIQYKKIIDQNQTVNMALSEKVLHLERTNEESMKLSEFQKNEMMKSYEEQIHFLSKEIVEFQSKITEYETQVFRLKKQNETKNFIENELIKFKRSQEQDQNKISSLELKNSELFNVKASLEGDLAQIKSEKVTLEVLKRQSEDQIEAQQQQLSLMIAENEKLSLRLKMLEKLNSQLGGMIKDQNS